MMRLWALALLTALALCASLLLACTSSSGDDDSADDDAADDDADDDNGGSLKDQCIAFYSDCYGVSADVAAQYCSVIDQYEGYDDCYQQAVEDYFTCIFENFDCESYDPNSIQQCADDFTQALIDCGGAADDDAADDDAADDDAADDDAADDDTADDDAADDDDDNDDDNDDDSTDYTCTQVADGMYNTCQITLTDLNSNQVDQAGLEDWCGLSESLFTDKTVAPAWQCMGVCAFEESCDQACFDNCLDPPDPGGTACDHTINGIYACGVVFVFNADQTKWIPEMDMAGACSSMTTMPWSCYEDCVETVTCSDPPTQPEAQAMIACLNAC